MKSLQRCNSTAVNNESIASMKLGTTTMREPVFIGGGLQDLPEEQQLKHNTDANSMEMLRLNCLKKIQTITANQPTYDITSTQYSAGESNKNQKYSSGCAYTVNGGSDGPKEVRVVRNISMTRTSPMAVGRSMNPPRQVPPRSNNAAKQRAAHGSTGRHRQAPGRHQCILSQDPVTVSDLRIGRPASPRHSRAYMRRAVPLRAGAPAFTPHTMPHAMTRNMAHTSRASHFSMRRDY